MFFIIFCSFFILNILKSLTLEVVNSTADKKDGPALCTAFGDLINRTEAKHKCRVRYFSTDADGGCNSGRKLLQKERPYLITPSCWAHQVCASHYHSNLNTDTLHIL